MKTLLMTVGLALSYTANAQWITKTVDNGFDPKYNIAYTDNTKMQWLKLEDYNSGVSFYIGGVYVCDDDVDVDISFLVYGEYKKFNIKQCDVSEDRKTVFFTDNLEISEMLPSFIASTLVKVRINDITCGESTYEFNMNYSMSAFNFIDNN